MSVAPVLALMLAAEPSAVANQAFQNRNWQRAAELYRAAIKAHPEQASSWARLGRSLLEAGHAREAIPVLQKAESLGFPCQPVQYERALAHAKLGEKDAAVALLRALVIQGFEPPADLPPVDRDPAVASDPRFRELATMFSAIADPSVQPGTPWRRFDFWVGAWGVRSRAEI